MNVLRTTIVTVVISIAASCSSRQPVSAESKVLKLFAVLDEAAKVTEDLKSNCMVGQGFGRLVSPKAVSVMIPDPDRPPVAQLVGLSDAELQAKIDLLNMPMPVIDPAETRVRYEEARIDGKVIAGGCTAWTRQKAKETDNRIALANAAVEQLAKEDKKLIGKREAANAGWLKCLEGETARVAAANGIKTEGGLTSHMGLAALEAIRNGPDLQVARQRLSLLKDEQKIYWDENKRCESTVDHEKLDEIYETATNETLAKLDLESILNP
jgi:hypothetical protein